MVRVDTDNQPPPVVDMVVDASYLVVRAQVDDRDELLGFDPRFETTRYPVELLWGPGTAEQARAWVEAHRPVDDEVDTLDRYFVIRHHGDRIGPPAAPLSLPDCIPANGPEPGSWSRPTTRSARSTTSATRPTPPALAGTSSRVGTAPLTP
jgi:hypothetical protein